jgi:hypothetical protein
MSLVGLDCQPVDFVDTLLHLLVKLAEDDFVLR